MIDTKNIKIENAHIFDVTPTILHTLGVPISRNMDGKVLTEIFKEESKQSKIPVKYQKIGEKDVIAERIKKLRRI